MTLQRIEMFQGLSNMELAKLLGQLDKRSLPAGSTLFEQGDSGQSMYIIEQGEVALYAVAESGSRQLLAVLYAGDALGEMALLTDERRSASAVAQSDTMLFEINRKTFDRLIAEHPLISAYFIRLLSRRLVNTNQRLQASKETETQWVRQELEQMEDKHREFLLWCMHVQAADDKLVAHTFGFGLEAELASFPKLAQWLSVSAAVDGRLRRVTVLPAMAEQLRKLELSGAGAEHAAQRVADAAGYYESSGDYAAAAELYADHKNWEALLNMAGAALQGGAEAGADAIVRTNGKAGSTASALATQAGPQQAAICQQLHRCPQHHLTARFDLVEYYIDYCRKHDPASGLTLIEFVLNEQAAACSRQQLLAVYEWGAELSRCLNRRQQAYEYMQLAEAAALSLSEPVGGKADEERAFQLAKQKVAGRRHQYLAENAGRLVKRRSLTAICAIMLALLCLVLPYVLEPTAGLSREAMIFIGIALAAVIMWIINIVPDYIVALGMVMLWVLSGTVDAQTALSGFASTTWLFMIFIMAISAVIMKSGILYRFSLNALKRFPPTYRGQLWGVVVGGIVMNPLIPSSSAKVSLGVPVAQTLSESMGLAEKSRGAAGLGLAAMIFYGFTAPFVLTGSYTNVMAYGLVSQHSPITWLQWFFYALPAFAIFCTMLLLVLTRMFRNAAPAKTVSPEVLHEQLRLLGPLTREERLSLFAVVGSIGLMMLQPLHGIDSTWIMLLGFSVLVVSGVLDRKTIASGIDWTFLLFLGVAFSFAGAVRELGIAEVLSTFLNEYMAPFASSPALFLLAVIVLSFVVTLVIRDDPAVILLVTALLPLAEGAGIHPWIVVFVILLATDPFFFAYQSPTYLTAYYSTEGKAFNHRQGQRIGLWYAFAVLLLTMLCIPYWQWLDLL
ncbi:hypothetical protein EBB07_06080 [Paenibacillaceae bacterium]|nr:hypothetical protein EBB07_06080 [Paenibacillaceae bacterium]